MAFRISFVCQVLTAAFALSACQSKHSATDTAMSGSIGLRDRSVVGSDELIIHVKSDGRMYDTNGLAFDSAEIAARLRTGTLTKHSRIVLAIPASEKSGVFEALKILDTFGLSNVVIRLTIHDPLKK